MKYEKWSLTKPNIFNPRDSLYGARIFDFMIEYLGKLKTEFENLLTFKNRGQKSRDTLPFTLHSISP